jgi:2-polyprenyl-6-methoxyphenol hydroxylase-like FAD-dependent oxidoreductase
MRVLISGAGLAGPAVAYWLTRYGFSCTLVEKAATLRTGGYKIDVRGAALEVLRRMDLYEAVAAAKTDIQGATVVDRDGQLITQVGGDEFGLRSGDDLEIVRGTLCQLLMGRLQGVDLMLGDSIQTISEASDGVYVQFENSESQRFDLVIGADGLHSSVRQLVFGQDTQWMSPLGVSLCVFSIPNYLGLDRQELEFFEPGKMVYIWSTRGDTDAKAAFAFVTSQMAPDSVVEQKQLLRTIYQGLNWEVPRLLELMEKAPDFYFDGAIQVCMDRWSQGRVVLLGDAGYCPSPMSGQGTSLALIGAYILAGELAAAKGNYQAAFAEYERQMRPFVLRNQALGVTSAKMMRMQERGGFLVWLHNQLMRRLPGRWRQWIIKKAGQEVHRAANSITLKDYQG